MIKLGLAWGPFRWGYDFTTAAHFLATVHGERIRFYGVSLTARWSFGVMRNEVVHERAAHVPPSKPVVMP